jgi:hypothetical protein
MRDVAKELGWHRNTVLEARKSCEQRAVLQIWAGQPLGEGNGNKPHVFRFGVPYQIKGNI